MKGWLIKDKNMKMISIFSLPFEFGCVLVLQNFNNINLADGFVQKLYLCEISLFGCEAYWA
jgi:hypothetical protein